MIFIPLNVILSFSAPKCPSIPKVDEEQIQSLGTFSYNLEPLSCKSLF
jgi:hypothetical protein